MRTLVVGDLVQMSHPDVSTSIMRLWFRSNKILEVTKCFPDQSFVRVTELDDPSRTQIVNAADVKYVGKKENSLHSFKVGNVVKLTSHDGSAMAHVWCNRAARLVVTNVSTTDTLVELADELYPDGKRVILESHRLYKLGETSHISQKEVSNMSDKRGEAQGTLNALLRVITLKALVEAGDLTEKEALFASHCADDETLDQAYDKHVNKIKEAADYDRQAQLKELKAEEERLKTVDEKRADVRKKIAELEKQ